jgi:long-chain acyl-CoA synthetase
VEVAQGYGMTEASPVISTNNQYDNEPASVGRPLPGVEVRIGGDDELLVRSPGVMMGYWNDPQATREAVDAEGWLHTGDKARIEDGLVYITGRIKDILVLSNGEKVPPGDVEAAITVDPLFEQALVLGEGRSHLAALVVLNPALWPGLAAAHGLDPADAAALDDAGL